MPSLIDEHQPFQDDDGKPIVNGSIYIGTQNQDPVSNPITIYSDRALTTTISNPQNTDSSGRAINKIWVPGKYSIQVDDSADIQKYQNLDAGDLSETGITTLTNVAGTNTITANGSPAVLTLTDNQQYNFRAANANTGAVTLQIDLTTVKTIKKQHDVDLVTGDIEQNQTVSVIYNATDDVFELVSNASIGSGVDLNLSGDLTVGGDVTVTGGISASNNPIIAARLYVTTGTQSITSGAGLVAVIWDAADFENINVWDVGTPTRITIPAGYTKMRLNAFVYWQNDLDYESASIVLFKNGSSSIGQNAARDDIYYDGSTQVNPDTKFDTGWQQCVATDYFEVHAAQINTNADARFIFSSVSLRTWISIELSP